MTCSWVRGVISAAALLLMLPSCGPQVDSAPLPNESLAMDPEVRRAINAAHARTVEHPGDAAIRGTLAMLYDAAHMFREAELTYAQAATLDAKDARWWYHLARMRKELGAMDDALRTMEHAATLAPASFIIPLRRGMWRLEMGETELAEADLRAALTLKPDSKAVRHGLARAYVMNGKYEAAVELLEPLRTQLPADSTIRQLLGRCYTRMGRVNDGAAEMSYGVASRWDWTVEDPWLAEVLSLRRGYRARFDTAMTYINAGAADRAMPIIDQLLVDYPDDLPTAVMLCGVLQATGQYQRGIDLLTQLDNRLGDHFAIKLNLAIFYQARNDMTRSMHFTNEAIKLHPQLAAAHVQKARLLMLQQQLDAAEASANEAILADANDPQARFVKANCFMMRNRYAEAEQMLLETTRQHPHVAQGFALLSAAQFSQGKRAEAMNSLAVAERLDPNDATLRSVRTGIAQSQGGGGQGNR